MLIADFKKLQKPANSGLRITRSLQLIDYGYTYLEVTVPQMRSTHLRELLTEIFPRKITLHTPDDADDALPELIAFWEYLQREYNLPASKDILSYLRGVNPAQFKQGMNDSSRFGMAKSFLLHPGYGLERSRNGKIQKRKMIWRIKQN